jgi:hypothetical protein
MLVRCVISGVATTGAGRLRAGVSLDMASRRLAAETIRAYWGASFIFIARDILKMAPVGMPRL